MRSMENGFCGFAMAGCRVVVENAFFEFAWSLPRWFDSCRTMSLKCLTSSIYIQSVSVEERSHLADRIFHTYHCRFFPWMLQNFKKQAYILQFCCKVAKADLNILPSDLSETIYFMLQVVSCYPFSPTPVVEQKLVVTFVNDDNWAFTILDRKYIRS